MITNIRYWFLLLLVVLVYISGIFVSLFENDSAQFAVMAMRMVQENDFLNLFKGSSEYLDKPHLHFWLAALSFKIFGIQDWAYRIPSILTTFLAAYSCYGLGKLLYHENVGKLAALIFMTAQTIVLSNIDVRTDAVLTGFVIFAIWQFVAYVETKSLKSIALGALGAGLAFSSKGQIGLLVIAISLLCHIGYTKKWKLLFNWKVLAGLVVFALTIAPVLYAYYHQFDLHLEKVISGKSNRSGIFFIFFEKIFERVSEDGIEKNSNDYLFFFHTFLWVFLPWTIVGLFAYYRRVKNVIKLKLKDNGTFEFLTIGGISIFFLIISLFQLRLAQNLNIIMPLFAVLTASYLYRLYKHANKKEIRVLLVIQYIILCLAFVASLLICFYVFKFSQPQAYIILVIALLVIVYFCLKREVDYIRIVTLSVYSSMLLNGVLNMHFYPSLLKYQGGSVMAKEIAKEKIPVDNIYKVNNRPTWALDFYNQKPVQIAAAKELKNKKDVWVYANVSELKELQDAGIDWNKQIIVDQYNIEHFQAEFLIPIKRKAVLSRLYLLHIY